MLEAPPAQCARRQRARPLQHAHTATDPCTSAPAGLVAPVAAGALRDPRSRHRALLDGPADLTDAAAPAPGSDTIIETLVDQSEQHVLPATGRFQHVWPG